MPCTAVSSSVKLTLPSFRKPLTKLAFLLLLACPSYGSTVLWDTNSGTADAQDGAGNWTVGGTTFWNTTLSTNVATTNDAVTDIAQFGNNTGAGGTVNVSTQSINGLIFGQTTTTGYTLSASTTGQVLTIGSSGITLNSGALATTVGSANLGITLSASQTWLNNSANMLTVAGALTPLAAGTLTFDGTGDFTITATTPSSNTSAITKNGTGTVTWSADINTTGALNINAGVFFLNLSASAASDMTTINVNGTSTFRVAGGAGLSSNSVITLASGAVYDDRFSGDTISRLLGTGTVMNGSGTAGTTTLNVSSSTNATFDGVITDNGSALFALTKQGSNIFTLTGANAYTGTTTITQGTLALDFTSAGGVSSNIINGSSALTMNPGATNGSATLSILGAASETNSQTFASTTISSGTSTLSLVSGAGGTLNVTLKAITVNAAAALNIVAPASGTIATTNAAGLMGGNVTYTSATGGISFAKVAGGFVTAATPDFVYETGKTIDQVTGYTSTGILGLDNSSTGNTTQAAGTTVIAGLDYSDTAARTMSLGTGNRLQLALSGGILADTTAGNLTIGSVVDDGTLTAGASGAGALTLHELNSSATLTVNAIVANNAGGGAVSISKTGTGRVVLAGTNTYTGTTTINAGALEIQNSSSLGGTAGATTVFTGAALELSGGISVGAEALTINGTGIASAGALRNISGTNSYSGTITLGSATTIGSTAGTLTLGGAMAVGNNNITFSGTGNTTVNGIITQGATNNPTFTKNGTGTLTLNAVNSLAGTGAITLDGGTVVLGNAAALPTTRTLTMSTNGAATLRLATDTSVNALVLTTSSNNATSIVSDRATQGAGITHVLGAASIGNNTMNITAGTNVTTGTAGVSFASLNLTAGGAGTAVLNPTTATVTVVGAVNIGSNNFAKTLNLGGTSTGNLISGVISNGLNTLSLTKSNTSTWTLTNTETYTGATAITGGTLVLGSGANLAATAVTVSSGATLAVNPGTTGATNSTGSTLVLNAGSIFSMNDGATSTFNVTGATTFAATDTLNFDIGGATTAIDRLAITGVATSGGGVVYITGIGSTALTAGNYSFITAASGLGTANFSLGTPNVAVGGVRYGLSLSASTGTAEILTVSTTANAATSAFWTGSQDSSWNTTNTGGTFNTNFSVNAAGTINTFVLPSANTNVTFTATTATNLSTTLDANFSINSLTFSGTGTANTAGSTIASGTGANKLTINATNANGNTAGNGITVASGSGANTISADVVLGASQTWTVNNAVTAPLAVTGSITEATAGLVLTKAGTGALTLAGTNSYTGGTVLSAGVLNVNSTNALGSGALTISGGTLDNTSGAALTEVTNNAITIGASFTFSTAAGTASNNLNLGTGAVSVGASRTVTLNGTGTTLTLGGVVSNTTSSAQTLTVNGAGNTLALGSLVLQTGGSAAITQIFNGTGNISVAGVISNGASFANGVTYSGTGTMTLGGVNTYTGKTTVSSGVLSVSTLANGGTASGVGASSNAAANLVIGATGTLQYTGATVTIDRAFTSSAGGKIEVTNAGTNLTLGSGAALSGAFTKTGAGTLTLTGSATNTGVAPTVTAGTLVLAKPSSASVNTVTSTLTIAGGTVQLAGSGGDQIVDTVGVVINSGTLDMGGKNEVVGALSGTGGNVTNSSATTSTLTSSTGSGSFGATIADGAGKINVVKSGSGTLTFTAAGSNSYSGTTTVNSGSLVLNYANGSTNLIGDASAVTLGNATLSLTGAVTNEVIASIAVSANAAASIILGSANEKLTITSNTVTMGAGSTLNFNTAAGGADASTSTLGTGIVAWNPTLTNGIINSGITVTDSTGTGFATVVGGNVVRLVVSNLLPASGAVSSTNYLVDNNAGGPSAPGSSSLTLTANEGAATVTVDTSASAGTLDLNGFVLTSDGWSFNGSNRYTITNSGAATAALKSSTSNATIALNNYSTGGVEIDVPILANGTGGLSLNGPNTTTFGGPSNASTYTGATTINGGTVVIANDNALSTVTSVGIGNNSTSTANIDLSSASQKFGGLTVSSNSATANVITVGAAETLTLTGSLLVGTDQGASSTSKLTMTGGGALVMTPTGTQNVTVGIGQASANFGHTATLDLSGLGSVTLGSSGAALNEVRIGYGQLTNGIVILSNTANSITATTLYVANSLSLNSNSTSTLTLGTGTNTFAVDNFNVGFSKAAGIVQFASQTAGSAGTVTIGGKSAAGANFIIGSNNGTATAAADTGVLDLRGHVATVTAASVQLGIANNAAAGGATGTISMDAGTFTADNVVLGSKAGTNGTGLGAGIINLSGTASFTVNAGGSFAMAANSAVTGTATGLLNITGGTFTSNVDITKTGGTGTTATVTLNGGTLDLSGKNMGTAANQIVFNAQSGVMQNVNEINGGGAVTKTTTGTLTLLGTNSYTGATTVSAGTFQVGDVQAGSTGSSAITVNGAGTVLAGTGTINGATVVTQGSIKPGGSAGAGVGTLTINNSLSVATASSIRIDLSGTTSNNDAAGLAAAVSGGTLATWAASHANDAGGTSNDLLSVNGALTLGGTGSSGSVVVVSSVSGTYGATAAYGDVFNVLDWTSLNGTFSVGSTLQGVGGTFGDLSLPVLTNGEFWDVSQFMTTGVIFVAPEPSRALFVLFGLGGVALRRRRRCAASVI